MAIGKISGQMLFDNLDRSGVNLSIDGNLTFFDMTNRRVGINNSNPAYPLDVNGNAHLGNLYILNDSITSDTGKINLGNITNLTVAGGSPDQIVYTDGSGNLAFGSMATLAGLEGFTANNIIIGTSAQSNDGYGTNALTTGMDVATAINTLDNILGNITNNTGTVISVTGNISGANIIASGSIISPTINTINANITAANLAIATLNSNVGAFETYANLQISSTNSNVTALGTYSNANAAVQAISIQSLATGANANTAAYLNTYTGNINSANFTGNLYGNIHADLITPYKTTVTTFNSTTAVGLPTGGNIARPSSPVAGQIRYNSDYNTVEFYNGIGWVSVISNITGQNFYGDGTNNTFNLNQTTTANGVLVSINGTVQQPVYAYTVSGNQITFTETPLITDQIDVRFLAAAVTVDNIFNTDISVTGNITLSGLLSAPQTTKASNAPGTAGQICWDANYIYVCTATNTWKRSPLTGGY